MSSKAVLNGQSLSVVPTSCKSLWSRCLSRVCSLQMQRFLYKSNQPYLDTLMGDLLDVFSFFDIGIFPSLPPALRSLLCNYWIQGIKWTVSFYSFPFVVQLVPLEIIQNCITVVSALVHFLTVREHELNVSLNSLFCFPINCFSLSVSFLCAWTLVISFLFFATTSNITWSWRNHACFFRLLHSENAEWVCLLHWGHLFELHWLLLCFSFPAVRVEWVKFWELWSLLYRLFQERQALYQTATFQEGVRC